ncbi:TetR/AcrR family transcriptional regulator [Streptomyces sp. R-74717]|uniref:TetR/AcrR family transcriptional regulator n=1 Tax=Streptomyces TaxID=1883 RepID=UPI0037885E74
MPHISGTPNRRGIQRREQILDAAQDEFGDVGFGATTLRSLAKRLGMTHAGILRHYSSKEDVLLALLRRTDARAPLPTPAAGAAPRVVLEELAADALHGDRSLGRLYLKLLGEARSADHAARSYVRERLRAREELFTAAGLGRASEPGAALDGLQVLHAYLPERVSPADVVRIHGDLLDRMAPTTPDPAAWIPRAGIAPTAPSQGAAARTQGLDRVDEILDAAALAFARHGYHGTSLRSVAASLDLAHGTLLYYFDSKEALLGAVLNRFGREADKAYITPVTAYDKVANVYRRAAYNETVPEPVSLYSALLCEATSPGHPAHTYFADRYTRVLDTLTAELRSLQRQGFVRGDADLATEAAWFTALWDGLQLHTPYTGEGHIPQTLLHALNDLIADSVSPGDRSALLTVGT